MAKLSIRADAPGPVIDRNIYGHFAEHLGRCVYEGLWVGEDSPIPNTRGIRNDVAGALKRMGIPALRWPGGCFAAIEARSVPGGFAAVLPPMSVAVFKLQ